MSDVETKSEPKVQIFMHRRKGPITGVLLSESDDWLSVRVYGDQMLTYTSISNQGRVDGDGEVINIRRSLVSEIRDA